jgi:LuxR family maltose regulon positive regulatory protein
MELSRIVALQQRLEQAEQICRTELMLAEQSGTAEMPAFCLVHLALADILRARGSLETSESHLEKGLKTAMRTGHEFYLAKGYLIAARLHHALGKTSSVQEDIQQAERIAASIHNQILNEAIERTCVETKGPMQNSEPEPKRQLIEPLSHRELEVLHLICEGKSNQEIADELFVSLNTIKRHTNNIFGKMGVSRRAQAIHEAHNLGLR